MNRAVAAYVIVPLMWRQQVGSAALVVPQWITADVGVAFWLFLDVMWKQYHASRVHEAPAIVALHLSLGLAGLAIGSGVLGRLARRTAPHRLAASGADPGPLTCERTRPARCCA